MEMWVWKTLNIHVFPVYHNYGNTFDKWLFTDPQWNLCVQYHLKVSFLFYNGVVKWIHIGEQMKKKKNSWAWKEKMKGKGFTKENRNASLCKESFYLTWTETSNTMALMPLSPPAATDSSTPKVLIASTVKMFKVKNPSSQGNQKRFFF